MDITNGVEIDCGYGRKGTVELSLTKCDITGANTLCIVVDNSEAEYGAIAISLTHIQQQVLNSTGKVWNIK